ncbi:MAG: WD40 repeat domain-containing protein, partial [Alphaproteobacteria bacterium]
MTLRALLLAAAVALAAPPGATVAQAPAEPPGQPFLRVDPGFHTQIVNRVATDGEGRIAATASDDKTIRLWSVADGRALSTIRVPIAEGDQEGEIYAVAISPDGATLLAGGHTGWAWDRAFCLYLFDVVNQRLRGRLPRLPAPINHIAYSADGKRFALALGGRAGIRVHDATSGQLLFADDDFADRATAVAFAGDGRLAATGFDGAVRLYAPDGKRVARRELKGGRPYGLAFARDGRTIAVGMIDAPRVELLAGRDLKPVRTLRVDGGGGLAAVAWARDGRLLAGGSVRDRGGAVAVMAWPASLKGAPQAWPVAQDTVSDIEPLPDGGALVASADPALVLVSKDGRAVAGRGGLTFDLREVGERRLALSADGTVLDLHPRGAPRPLRIDLGQRRIGEAEGPLDGTRTLVPVRAPPTEPLRVASWRNEPRPTLIGRPLALDPEELARSQAITADQRFLLLGTDYFLRVYRADGSLAARLRTPGTAWGVTVARDGRTVAAALGDGTLRWYGLASDGTLEERVAVVLATDLRRWIAWTPEGFFDHAVLGGKELVGYHLNRGRAELADWLSFALVYRLFYAP